MTTNHYVSNKELYDAFVIYKTAYDAAIEAGTELPKVPEEIGSAIMRIAEKTSTRFNFVRYWFRDEMVGDAMLKCIIKAHRFDIQYKNPFAFLTQIIWNEFVERIRKEQHQTSVKARVIKERMSTEFIEHCSDLDDTDGGNAYVEFLQDNEVFVDYYEERKAKKNEIHPSFVHRNKTAPITKDKIMSEKLSKVIDIFSGDDE